MELPEKGEAALGEGRAVPLALVEVLRITVGLAMAVENAVEEEGEGLFEEETVEEPLGAAPPGQSEGVKTGERVGEVEGVKDALGETLPEEANEALEGTCFPPPPQPALPLALGERENEGAVVSDRVPVGLCVEDTPGV